MSEVDPRDVVLDGLTFRAVENSPDGETSGETLFRYREDGDMVWADYAGGAVRRGHLVGTRDGDRLEFRYAQLNADGVTSTGHCVSRIVPAGDGRVRLLETWEWESRPGSGTSVVEQVDGPVSGPVAGPVS